MLWLLLYPFYFSWAAFFPLHLKLIIRLLLCHSSVPSHLLPASIEKTGMFCKGTKAGWHYLAGVLWCSSPLEKQPRKVSFWDQKSSWFMAFDASCLLTKTHRFDITQTDYFQEKNIWYIFPSFSFFKNSKNEKTKNLYEQQFFLILSNCPYFFQCNLVYTTSKNPIVWVWKTCASNENMYCFPKVKNFLC